MNPEVRPGIILPEKDKNNPEAIKKAEKLVEEIRKALNSQKED